MYELKVDVLYYMSDVKLKTKMSNSAAGNPQKCNWCSRGGYIGTHCMYFPGSSGRKHASI